MAGGYPGLSEDPDLATPGTPDDTQNTGILGVPGSTRGVVFIAVVGTYAPTG